MSAELKLLLEQRLSEVSKQTRDWVEQSTHIAVFGSAACRLEQPESDLDVLCVGPKEFKFKSPRLEITSLTEGTPTYTAWRQGELAFHLSRYSVWLKGDPAWSDGILLGESAVSNKLRRLSAFLRFLPGAWKGLGPNFHKKYSVKLRRETQRLLLLEGRVPIPPTLVLDSIWANCANARPVVVKRLNAVAEEVCVHQSFVSGAEDSFGMVNLMRMARNSEAFATTHKAF